jgi:hypothetical protein
MVQRYRVAPGRLELDGVAEAIVGGETVTIERQNKGAISIHLSVCIACFDNIYTEPFVSEQTASVLRAPAM